MKGRGDVASSREGNINFFLNFIHIQETYIFIYIGSLAMINFHLTRVQDRQKNLPWLVAKDISHVYVKSNYIL